MQRPEQLILNKLPIFTAETNRIKVFIGQSEIREVAPDERRIMSVRKHFLVQRDHGVFLLPYILFLIGQLFFMGYFFKQKAVRKFMDKT